MEVSRKEMAVKIRLTRMGAKKRPFYRLIAANSESPRDGKFLDILGYYNPMKEPPEIRINKGKVQYWLERGALLTEAAKNLLKKEGLINPSSN